MTNNSNDLDDILSSALEEIEESDVETDERIVNNNEGSTITNDNTDLDDILSSALEDLGGDAAKVPRADSDSGFGEQFVYAAGKGDLAKVTSLLLRGMDINFTSKVFKKTALHAAAAIGQSAIVDRLVQAGVDLDKQCGHEQISALHLAVGMGHYKVVDKLLRAGAQVDPKLSDDGSINARCTPLGMAVNHNRPRIAVRLLEAGADPEAPIGVQRHTPLLRLAAKGPVPVSMVTALLEGGANVDAKDHNQMTSLHCASVHGWVELIRALLEAGADVEALDRYRQTPLFQAAMHGQAAAVELLLGAGASPSTVNFSGMTPLHACAGDYEYYSSDPGVANQNCVTVAVGSPTDYVDAARLLLAAGASLEAIESESRMTPLQMASEHVHPELAQLLLEAGADVWATSFPDMGITALRFAEVSRRTGTKNAEDARRTVELLRQWQTDHPQQQSLVKRPHKSSSSSKSSRSSKSGTGSTEEKKKKKKKQQRKKKEGRGCDGPDCNNRGEKFCKGCRHAIYCGALCQRLHWREGGHKQECTSSSPAAGDA